MNKVEMTGRLTSDPQIYRQGESISARYTLAVNRRFKKEGSPEADFVGCVVFGKAADFAEKFLRKGVKIGVVGRIQTGSYVNKDGQKVYTTDVVVEEQEFEESKNSSSNTPAPATPTAAPAEPAPAPSEPAPSESDDGFVPAEGDPFEDMGDDLPFPM